MTIPVRYFFPLLFCHAAVAQSFVISTVAGGLPPATPATASTVSIGDPPRVAVDAAGNVYFGSLHAVFKVDRTGTMTRIAGTGLAGYSGDNGPATSAQFLYPDGIAVDSKGTVYVSDRLANVVRKISSGTITTFAGTGTAGSLGDGGPAASALLNTPAGLALDSQGQLFIADSGNHTIRRVALDGTITTFAGNAGYGAGYGGDFADVSTSLLNGPSGIAIDASNQLYIADTFNDRVRKVATNGVITTIAGTGVAGAAAPDGQPATSSPLFLPTSVAVSSSGVVYIADLGNSLVRTVSGGVMNTVAGNSKGAPPTNGQEATSVRLSGPTGVAVDSNGNLFIVEGSIGSGSGLAAGSFHVWRVTTDGVFASYAGNGWNSFAGDGGAASLAMLNAPAGMARDSQGNLYVADSKNQRVRKIAPNGTITTIAGTGVAGFQSVGRLATDAQLNTPLGVAVSKSGVVYIADSANNRIRQVFPDDGTISTKAGNGNAGFFGDGGNGLDASLHAPSGLAIDSGDNIYVADTLDYRIRKIDSFGNISTLAGNGNQGSSGDGGPAINASLTYPVGVAVDNDGNVYIADAGAGVVRKVSQTTGIITTLQGGLGPGNNGQLSGLRGVAVDNAGNVYSSDFTGNQVRQVSPSGLVTLVAGNGTCCYSGDGGPALLAQLNQPWALLSDGTSGLYVADSGNNAIRQLTPGSVNPLITSVVNGASNLPGPVAPGEIVVIHGSGLGPSQIVVNSAANGFLGTVAGGVNVLMNGIPAPMVYAVAGQVSAIVPYGVIGTTVQVVVSYQAKSSLSYSVPLGTQSPAMFTSSAIGVGQAAAINQDNTLNSATHPAPIGSIITLYATGEGQTSPSGVDGKLAGVPAPAPLGKVTVAIGGQSAEVKYAGGTPTVTAGLLQINAVVPVGAPVGNSVEVLISVGGVVSPQGVTIAVGGN